MATEFEISIFLRGNNLTESQVDLMWSELIQVSQMASYYDQIFGSWQACPFHVIKRIPTEKERELKRIEEEEKVREKMLTELLIHLKNKKL